MTTDLPLPAPGQSAELLIHGPAGRIEALLQAPKMARARPGIAVVCHPHPLYGGALSNKVAYALASCAQKAGLHALRFNFRGVGRSEGTHDDGRGETEDTLFLVDWMRHRLPGARLLLAGFSFGAFVSVKAAGAARPDALVSIAPPFAKYFAEPLPQRPDCPWLVVHGSDDEVVDCAETEKLLKQYAPPPEWVKVDGVGHFFHGRLDALNDAVQPFLDRHFA